MFERAPKSRVPQTQLGNKKSTQKQQKKKKSSVWTRGKVKCLREPSWIMLSSEYKASQFVALTAFSSAHIFGVAFQVVLA